MKLSGARIVWESLVDEGIEVIFGIPGGAVIPIYHALPEYDIRHVLMRHEQAAIHAADGYARATGKVGTCMVTSGPGATNLVTGLITAYVAESPVVAITGQSPTPVLGTDAFQEVDIATITMAVTKHNYLITAIQELPEAIKEAFYLARTGRPGPVLISITSDVQKSEDEFVYPDRISLPGYDPTPQSRSAADDEDEAADRPLDKQTISVRLFQTLMEEIGHATQGKAMVVAEQGYKTPDSNDRWPGVTLVADDFGTPGFALPAAIGAQLGFPDETAWVITDDICLQANVQELATVIQENLPLRIVVLNRGLPATILSGSPLYPGKASARAPLLSPDFTELAGAYGIPALKIKETAGIETAIGQAAAASGPILLDLDLERDEGETF